MKEKWYYKIVNQILDIKTDIILIEDHAKIVLFSKIKECLSEKFNNIVEFKSEVQIRVQVRKNERILVIFSISESIPYDLLSTYATTKTDLVSV